MYSLTTYFIWTDSIYNFCPTIFRIAYMPTQFIGEFHIKSQSARVRVCANGIEVVFAQANGKLANSLAIGVPW